MLRVTVYGVLAPVALLLSSLARPAGETIAPNDNRQAAGTLKNGVLTIALEARTGSWWPEGEHGRVLDSIAAFAEPGKPLSTPGPLIRVPVGTEVRASLRNRLGQPLIVYGFGKTRGVSDSVIVPPNASVPVTFSATTPGTFYYLAKRGVDVIGGRLPEDTQLHGFIIVDPPNAPRDRLFAISWLFTLDSTSRTGLGHGTMAINGLSWPHTEHLEYVQGDSIHWRVVNFTEIDHPMHLHGFYFRMESKGNGVADSLYSAAERRMAVTEMLNPFETISLSWYADRPGNWIYHCHYATHLSKLVALDTEKGMLDESQFDHHVSDRPHQMFGLVLGITVAPKGALAQSGEPPRVIRLLQREQPNVYGSQPGMSFVLDGTPEAANPAALPVPGPTLFLERGKPVAVTIVNQSNDHAAVHWHGIELQSYPDGVPGWSGEAGNILRAIPPHDSLTVRWTPPRAGSFMYHSHFSEAKQMGSGLYGPIIVLEPGQQFDSETDKILFFGTAGTGENVIAGPFPGYLLNGKARPEPLTLKAGTRYRFRFFNLAGDFPTLVSLSQGEQPVLWLPVAKDGYPLAPSQGTSRPALLVFD
ncbi:MAG TPA: multicopper oxidase domain-containing protein, partial [Gemmatimonadales bacterium]|nr:multicopper oxidase domain-containing protein [Gemmatimonadales bacterium]